MSRSQNTQKTEHTIQIVCGLFFILFSFLYLYSFQGNLLHSIYGVLFGWKAQFSLLICASAITVFLTLFSVVLNSVTQWKGVLYALTYLPVFLILGIFTNFDQTIYGYNFDLGIWWWLFPVLLSVYLLISWIVKYLSTKIDYSEHILKQLNPNLVLLILSAICTYSIGNTDIAFHDELQMDYDISQGEFAKAAKVDKISLEVSRRMSVQRAYALSKMDSLGENLFEYPQYYRSKGLFFAENSSKDALSVQKLRKSLLTNSDIYAYLKGKKTDISIDNNNILPSLKQLVENNRDNQAALNYYLSALLLEKHLNTFASVINKYGNEKLKQRKHYQEALLLYKELHPQYTFTTADTFIVNSYKKFKDLQKEYADPIVQKNFARRNFGSTYWWYYNYR